MKDCDLIMKGGLTSGVVYPLAISELSKEYRFVNIGGTSAGAIGAVIAAAAEYRRQASPNHDSPAGFNDITKIPDELGTSLKDLFVPTPELKPLFDILIDLTEADEGKSMGGVFCLSAIKHYRKTSFTVAMITLIAVIASSITLNFGWAAFSFLAGVVALIFILTLNISKAAKEHLPQNHFGLCTGTELATPKHEDLGGWIKNLFSGASAPRKIAPFTDWMSDKIDQTAFGDFIKNRSAPLLIKDLREHGIEIASMTTDLSTHRPYQLPLEAADHCFSEAEFRRLFPPKIMDYLLKAGVKEDNIIPGEPTDLYSLPIGDDMPVLLVARLSLSFPGLISAVPLYRRDRNLKDEKTDLNPYVKCIFSDGGISSNFPVHFFDSLLPSRPTFGINLSQYSEDRHGNKRVNLPDKPRLISGLPISHVEGLGGFFSSILNTAKDWQDTLQGLLPGYAERIVEIRLDPQNEGGLNLSMGPKTIKKLTGFGETAAKTLINDFNFSEHSYRRAISSVPFLEDSMVQYSKVYGDKNWTGQNGENWKDIFETYDPQHYKIGSATWRKRNLHEVAKEFHAIGKDALEREKNFKLLRDREPGIPYVDAGFRLVASPLRMTRERWKNKRKDEHENEISS